VHFEPLIKTNFVHIHITAYTVAFPGC